MRHTLLAIATSLVFGGAVASGPTQRSLTFEDRVRAQEAIERVYYSHQIGTTMPFERAVPRAVLEEKVRKYLDQTAALKVYWKTAVTDEMLQRELERMVRGTRMPERLLELYTAFDNDPVIIEECLARPALVDRLARNFYAFDPALHLEERRRAEELHRRLSSNELSVLTTHPDRSVVEFTMRETDVGDLPRERAEREVIGDRPHQLPLTPEEFRRRRAQLPASAEQVSAIEEQSDAFVFGAVLSETTHAVRAASYVIAKTSWDTWWESARKPLQTDTIATVATNRGALPVPAEGRSLSSLPCVADDTWNNGVLDALHPLSRHKAVWTGSLMVVWGGFSGGTVVNTGARYDPATDSWTATSTTNAPSARFAHSAVWTGSSMVVWGGVGGPALNTGGRYEPATDSWTPTSTTGAPAARYFHTAVWAGSSMVAWGGVDDNGNYLNTGARYDPATNTWTSTSTTGVPSGRYSHTAVWTGSTMVVWGGYDGGAYVNNGARYDPAANSWIPTSTMGAPSARYSHTAVWTGSAMAVWGGSDGTANFNTGGLYNPVTDGWTPMSSTGAPSARESHSAAWTGSLMVVWGGNSGNFPLPWLDTGGRYNPETDSWTPMSSTGAPSARESHSAVWTGSLVLFWGGQGRTSELSTGARYDPATDSWTPTSTTGAPSARHFQSTVWTGSLMVVWGGYDDSPSHALNTGARYDPAIDSWSPTSTSGAPSARYAHSAVWTGGLMGIWGGADQASVPNFRNTGGRYDPASDTWSPISTTGAPIARAYHTAVWTGTRMLVWGGENNSNGGTNTGGRYDPATDSWTPTSTTAAPSGRYYHTAVWTGTRMVVWGGAGGSPDFNTGGRYDPTTDTWTTTSTTGAPSARESHSALWTGSRMVVWGGWDAVTPALNTGGRYDPATNSWLATSVTGAPSARFAHTAVWTGSLMLIWGGRDGGYFPFDTGGKYNLATNSWSPTSPTGVPSARFDHTAVWTGSAMVVWGGYDGNHYFDTGGRYVLGAMVDSDGDGFTECQGDCNDGNAAVFPGAPENCDGVKNDCGAPGPAMPPSEADADGDGTRVCQGDCNDSDGTVYPGAPQLCDGKNNNCSDPSWPSVPANEANSDGDGFRVCGGDCDDSRASVYPGAPQICDGINTNCSDPGWPAVPAGEADADGDSYRVCGGDCDDTRASTYPGAAELCDGRDNDCDSQVDDDVNGVDTDGDGLHNACDNCPLFANPAQSDFDHDNEGDVCDLNDGLIYVYSTNKTFWAWQAETGYSTWNNYRGSLSVLRTTGQYTQAPGSSPLAARDCGLGDPYVFDPINPSPGEVAFNLVTGVSGGVESSLGTNSAGAPRANANPCP